MEVTNRELWHETNTTVSRSEIDDVLETLDRVCHREIAHVQVEFSEMIRVMREDFPKVVEAECKRHPKMSTLKVAETVQENLNAEARSVYAQVKQCIGARLQRLRRDKLKARIALGIIPNTRFASTFVGPTTGCEEEERRSIPGRGARRVPFDLPKS